MSRQSLDKQEKRKCRKKIKVKKIKVKTLNKGLSVLLAYFASSGCIVLVQYITNFRLPSIFVFLFQLSYAYVLYYKFLNMNLSDNKEEIRGKL